MITVNSGKLIQFITTRLLICFQHDSELKLEGKSGIIPVFAHSYRKHWLRKSEFQDDLLLNIRL